MLLFKKVTGNGASIMKEKGSVEATPKRTKKKIKK
jgi:hypothetical protein